MSLGTTEQLNDADKNHIRNRIDEIVQQISTELNICPEAVANEAFYRLQRHPNWSRNATQTQKRASHASHHGNCHKCGLPVLFKEAHFHHLKRGLPNQHQPENLVPEHEKCHDEEHHVTQGSLAKGTKRRQVSDS